GQTCQKTGSSGTELGVPVRELAAKITRAERPGTGQEPDDDRHLGDRRQTTLLRPRQFFQRGCHLYDERWQIKRHEKSGTDRQGGPRDWLAGRHWQRCPSPQNVPKHPQPYRQARPKQNELDEVADAVKIRHDSTVLTQMIQSLRKTRPACRSRTCESSVL